MIVVQKCLKELPNHPLSDVLSLCLKNDTSMWKMYVEIEIFYILSDLTSLKLKFGC